MIDGAKYRRALLGIYSISDFFEDERKENEQGRSRIYKSSPGEGRGARRLRLSHQYSDPFYVTLGATQIPSDA